MRAAGRCAALASLALALAAAPVGAAEDEGLPDPCAPSAGACAAVAQLWQAVVDATDAEPGDGASGLVAALLELQPDPDAPWILVRAAQEGLPEALPEAGAPGPAAPGPATPLLVVGAPTVALSPEHAALLEEAQAAAGGAPATADEALSTLPVDPRTQVAELVMAVGTLNLHLALPEPAAAPPPPPFEPGAVPPTGPPGWRATLRAPEPVDARHELLTPERLAAAPLEPWAPAHPGAPSTGPLAPSGAGPAVPPGTPLAAAAVAVLSLLLLLPPLYHRLQRHKLLDHATRARLYQVVSARPGIHIEELARAAMCSRSTAVYHLRLLARHGHLVAMGGRKAVHYYPNNGNGHDPHEREQRALLTHPRTRDVAARVLARPGLSRTEVAGLAGITVSTLSWHMGRLLERGLVEDRLLGGGRRGLFPAPVLAELLRPWESMPVPSRAAMPPADAGTVSTA